MVIVIKRGCFGSVLSILSSLVFRSCMSGMSSTVPHFWSIIRKSCKPFDGLFSKGYMKQIQGIKDKSDEHDVIRLT